MKTKIMIIILNLHYPLRIKTIMPYVNELRQRMLNDPIPKLEAIYNRCWSDDHNEIDIKVAQSLMSMIESVACQRSIDIIRRGGSFEFKELGDNDGSTD